MALRRADRVAPGRDRAPRRGDRRHARAVRSGGRDPAHGLPRPVPHAVHPGTEGARGVHRSRLPGSRRCSPPVPGDRVPRPAGIAAGELHQRASCSTTTPRSASRWPTCPGSMPMRSSNSSTPRRSSRHTSATRPQLGESCRERLDHTVEIGLGEPRVERQRKRVLEGVLGAREEALVRVRVREAAGRTSRSAPRSPGHVDRPGPRPAGRPGSRRPGGRGRRPRRPRAASPAGRPGARRRRPPSPRGRRAARRAAASGAARPRPRMSESR